MSQLPTIRRQHFGPWASAIDMGPQIQLSTFWKRRMAMLPALAKSGSRASSSAVLGVVCLATVVLATPTILFSTAAENVVGDPTPAVADAPPTESTPHTPSQTVPTPTLTTPTLALAPAPDEEFLPRPSQTERIIEGLLENPVAVDFSDEPLESVMKALLADERDAVPNFVIDKKALDDIGVGTDTPVTLALRGVSRKSALRLILEQLGLAYLIRDDVLVITSGEVAKQYVVTRVYPVADLTRDADELLKIMTATVVPDSWIASGGPGVVSVTDDNGSLVVLQTPENHERVLELLRALRAAHRTTRVTGDLAGDQVSQQPVLAANAAAPEAQPPTVIKTVPERGATDVDPALAEISITFDRDMSGGMSWTGGPPLFPPTDSARPGKWIDARTCVLPVKLSPAGYFRVGVNSKSHTNFRGKNQQSALPTAVWFATRGADEATAARVRVPTIVKFEPPQGAEGVDPSLDALRVTFDVPMGGGMSWTGGGPTMPQSPAGKLGAWSDDRTVCTLPVTLEPDRDYELSLNSSQHINFQSEWGVPLAPVVYKFRTAPMR